MKKRLIFSTSCEQTKTVPQVSAEASVLEVPSAVPVSGSERGGGSHNRQSVASISDIIIKSVA